MILQFETSLDNLVGLINENCPSDIRPVYHGRNERKAIWIVGNYKIVAQAMDIRLTELETTNFRRTPDNTAENTTKSLIQWLERKLPLIPIDIKKMNMADMAKKTIAKMHPSRNEYDSQELYQDAVEAFMAELERLKNITDEQAAVEEFLGNETRATIVNVVQAIPVDQSIGQKDFPEERRKEFDCPQDELFELLKDLDYRIKWPQNYHLGSHNIDVLGDMHLQVQKERLLKQEELPAIGIPAHIQGAKTFERIVDITIGKIGKHVSTLAIRTNNPDLLQFFNELIEIVSKYVHMRLETAAPVNLIAKPEKKQIFQVAHEQGGTITKSLNEQGQTTVGAIINPGYRELQTEGGWYAIVPESSGFVPTATYDKVTFGESEKPQEVLAATPKSSDWDKMTKSTKDNFRIAWEIYLTMCEEYKNDVLDGASQKAKPNIQDFRARVINDMNWSVGDRRLRDVIAYGEAKLIK